jgi:hypothetical protein
VRPSWRWIGASTAVTARHYRPPLPSRCPPTLAVGPHVEVGIEVGVEVGDVLGRGKYSRDT